MQKEEITIKQKCFDSTLVYMLLLMFFGYVLIHSLFGGTLFSHSAWDSYTLQALAWRNGSVALPQNYPWLELAIYKGQYFVSFPPFPSVVMLPFTFIFGENTPNNFIIMAATLCSAAIIFLCARKRSIKSSSAALIALAITWGSNLFWMSTNGGVWFMAQALNLLLLVWALHSALSNRRVLSYALIALAVGCRPFSMCAFIPLFVYYYLQDKQPGVPFLRTALRQWKAFILPIVIALIYMAYNYIRFDSPFEFGHNYLPEFLESPDGQFNISYLLTNLYRIFIRPIYIGESFTLKYPVFDGFMFYIANPFFILFFIRIASDIRHKRMEPVRIALLVAFVLNLLMLCAHKTFGGWQFGARYTVDMLPFALAYMLMGEKWTLKRYEKAVIIFGIMLNAYGALAMTFLHG